MKLSSWFSVSSRCWRALSDASNALRRSFRPVRSALDRAGMPACLSSYSTGMTTVSFFLACGFSSAAPDAEADALEELDADESDSFDDEDDEADADEDEAEDEDDDEVLEDDVAESVSLVGLSPSVSLSGFCSFLPPKP